MTTETFFARLIVTLITPLFVAALVGGIIDIIRESRKYE